MIEGYKEAVESPEKWDCHHRVESIMNCEGKELIAQGCYYDRPARELVFLPHSEHARLHGLGRRHSKETKEKMRQALSGKKNPMYGRRKENSHMYGMHWWNNGEKCVRSRECPGADWKRGRLRTGA
jgi:hypothetical protein